MSKLFGGSKSSSVTVNKAFDGVSPAFSPVYDQAQKGATSLQDLLSGNTAGLDTYKRTAGYDFAADTGSRGILNNAAAKGVFNSGATGKALVKYGTDLNSQFTGDYINRLLQQAQLGFNAGNVVTGAGSTNTSTSKTYEGIGKTAGAVASAVAASDRRLKKNIHKVGELKSGLNLYQYRYLDNSGPILGVMADEVAELLPEALGPVINGYATVDYGVVNAAEGRA
jgi:Chaperone of endosialidase